MGGTGAQVITVDRLHQNMNCHLVGAAVFWARSAGAGCVGGARQRVLLDPK